MLGGTRSLVLSGFNGEGQLLVDQLPAPPPRFFSHFHENLVGLPKVLALIKSSARTKSHSIKSGLTAIHAQLYCVNRWFLL